MIVISKEDKKYIEETNGVFSCRGIRDTLDIIRGSYGEEKASEIIEEMNKLGYDITPLIKREKQTETISCFVVLLLVLKKNLNLNNDDIKDIGKNTAKISFLLKITSRFIVSIDVLCNNANAAWKKYYIEGGGELCSVILDKENHHVVLELRNFVGHPAHCSFITGYIEQIFCFVTGNKKTICNETECLFNGGKVHRYEVRWD